VIIEKVEMTNFRSYRDEVVEFEKGVNVIVGENGAGKTSILEAIDFALFRETPKRVKINELISRGAEEEAMTVALTFQSNGRRFKVERARGKTNTDKLFQDGTMLTGDEKDSQTTKEVEGSIQMDTKLFTNAVHIKQGEIDALLSLDPAIRKKLMGKLIGTEDLENAWDAIPSVIGVFEEKIKVGLVEKKADIAQKIGGVEERAVSLKEEVTRINGMLNKENQNLTKSKVAWEECDTLYKENSDILVLTKDAQRLMENLDQVKVFRKRMKEQKKNYDLHLEFMRELEKLGELESGGKAAIDNEMETWWEKIRTIQGEIEGKKAEKRRVRKAVNELEEISDRCPVCGRDLDEEHKEGIVAEYEDEMRGISEELTKLEESLKKTEEEAAEVREKAMAELKFKSEALKEEQQKYKEGYEAYIAAESYLKEFAPKEDRDKGERAKIDKKLAKKRKALEKGLKKVGLYERLNEVPRENWQIELEGAKIKLRENFDEISQKLAKLQGELGQMEGESKEAKRVLEEYRTELKNLDSKAVENEKLLRFISLLKEIRLLFDKDHLQRELRMRHKPRIERYTREHFDKFNLAYTDIALTDDYSIMVYDSQGEKSADMLSGGERIAAALALRFGIANDLLESASAMELMILDEPTIHLDEHRRQELVEIVKRLSSIPQTIVVTHDREFEAAADRLISVRKEDGISSVGYGGG